MVNLMVEKQVMAKTVVLNPILETVMVEMVEYEALLLWVPPLRRNNIHDTNQNATHSRGREFGHNAPSISRGRERGSGPSCSSSSSPHRGPVLFLDEVGKVATRAVNSETGILHDHLLCRWWMSVRPLSALQATNALAQVTQGHGI